MKPSEESISLDNLEAAKQVWGEVDEYHKELLVIFKRYLSVSDDGRSWDSLPEYIKYTTRIIAREYPDLRIYSIPDMEEL
jgi:hypothetical protein